MTRITVTEENDMANGTRLGRGFSAMELVELSWLWDIEGGRGVRFRDVGGEEVGLENVRMSRSSGSLP